MYRNFQTKLFDILLFCSVKTGCYLLAAKSVYKPDYDSCAKNLQFSLECSSLFTECSSLLEVGAGLLHAVMKTVHTPPCDGVSRTYEVLSPFRWRRLPPVVGEHPRRYGVHALKSPDVYAARGRWPTGAARARHRPSAWPGPGHQPASRLSTGVTCVKAY